MEDIGSIQIIPHVGTRLHLYPLKVLSTLNNEVVAVVVAVRLGHREAKTHGFVHKRYFAEIALLEDFEAMRSPSLPGRAPPARWNASARTALGCAHELRWKSRKKKRRKLGSLRQT
jgi:hypothetical protein